ncbi:MFS general substrate transporter [Rhizodiscina lignyota]|uniref:MFS general substrate transporter n=1 Tax=Rhizodiscina lignyota TaxID=1504668 RepID=A0A9P4MGE6_9PEZI|nr:MFS general substrate transporter [Rhizodiscina lignyota]
MANPEKGKEYGTTTPEPGNNDSFVPTTGTSSPDPEKVAVDIGAQIAPAAENEAQERQYQGLNWYLVCIAVYVVTFMYGLDNTIVANIQAPIVERFGAVEKLGWLGIGFPLGSSALILPVGKAYGLFNVKWLYICSIIMFLAGSALCGGAPSMNALIFGRVWAGAGGTGMYLGVLNILSISTTIQERPLYMAITGIFWGLGCILGPVIGGAFADSSATWRWSFYINLIIAAVCAPVFLFILKPFHPRPGVPIIDKLKLIDWVGVALNISVYTFFVLVFTFGGAQWAWNAGGTIAYFVLFGVSLLAFVLQQAFAVFTTKENRLFPVHLLHDYSQVLLYISTCCQATNIFIPIYYIPLFYQFVHGTDGITAAVRLLPFMFIVIFSCMFNGAVMPRFGHYWYWYLVAGIFSLIGGSLFFADVDAGTSNSKIYGFSILLAIGGGIAQQAAYSISPALVDSLHKVPDAIGFINIAQIGGMVISLTITSSVFQNLGFKHLKAALRGNGFTDNQIHAALAGAKSGIFESTSAQIKERATNAVVKAISDGYILVITAAALGTICALLMKKEKVFLMPTAGG